MSAMPPIATIQGMSPNWRYGPKTDSCTATWSRNFGPPLSIAQKTGNEGGLS